MDEKGTNRMTGVPIAEGEGKYRSNNSAAPSAPALAAAVNHLSHSSKHPSNPFIHPSHQLQSCACTHNYKNGAINNGISMVGM
jgi:hypothetical protein